MGNIKEQQHYHVEHLPYLPISNRTIIEASRGKSGEQLGVSEGILFMIRQGFAKQLREDIFNKLSHALNLDISADNSSPKQP